MSMERQGLDHWRSYFKSARSSIFEVIEHGIMVAATDFPEEYRLKRGGIAEKLYAYQFTGNPGFNSMKASVGNEDLNVQKQNGGGDEKEVGGNGDVPKAECGQKTMYGSTEHEHAVTQMTNRNERKGKAMEDMNHEAGEESQILGEVLRIKELISNSRNEVTMVGKAVSDLRKHNSKQICQLAKTLIEGWQLMVDQWISATKGLSAREGISATKEVSAMEGISATKGVSAMEGASATKGVSAMEEVSATKGVSAMEGVSATKGVSAMERISTVEEVSAMEGATEATAVATMEAVTGNAAADSSPYELDEKDFPSLPLNDQEFPSLPWNESELFYVPMYEEDMFTNRSASAYYLDTFFDGLDEDGNPLNTEGVLGERMNAFETPNFNLSTTNLESADTHLNPSPMAKFINETESQQKSDQLAMPKISREARGPEIEEVHQQAENAKKPRTTRFMNLRNVAKPGLRKKSPHPRRRKP